MSTKVEVHNGVIGPQLIREIEDVRREDGPVTTLYLKVDVQFRGDPDQIRIALKDELKEVEGFIGELDARSRKEVEADMAAVRDAVPNLVLNPGMRSLACFVSSELGYARLFPLPWPVRTRGFFEERFVMWPLEEVLQQAEEYLVCLTDKDEARAFRYYLDQIEEVSAIFDEIPGKVRYPDPYAELRFKRRHTEKVHEHLEHVADMLFRHAQREPIDHVVIGGLSEVLPQLERHLHPYLAGRVTGRWHMDVHSNVERIHERARAEEQRVLKDQAEAIWRNIEEQFPHRASKGPVQVLEMLWQNRVHSLLMDESFSQSGKRCTSCYRLTTGGDVCPECGASMVDVADLSDEITLQATSQSARIRHLGDHEGLASVEGIASLNRF
jgi:peptide subunit release factor 1 (eRF1)